VHPRFVLFGLCPTGMRAREVGLVPQASCIVSRPAHVAAMKQD
jgi:hypothetical protein